MLQLSRGKCALGLWQQAFKIDRTEKPAILLKVDQYKSSEQYEQHSLCQPVFRHLEDNCIQDMLQLRQCQGTDRRVPEHEVGLGYHLHVV